VIGCGGGGSSSGGSASTGTIVIGVTDAKPMLPAGTEEVLITFFEVSVHRPGGGWITLPLAQTPYTIDLLQFSDGTTTDLVPPVQLLSGKYTQIRIGVTDASIKINDDYYPVEIPSENLKTDKQFDFEVLGGGAVDLTVDFDLSQSIVVTGSNTYKLKPVLHINETQEAATIQGRIDPSSFGASSLAFVTVHLDKDRSGGVSSGDEIYTEVIVTKTSATDPTEFQIFWLVPDQYYVVSVDVDGAEFTEALDSNDTQSGAIFSLNDGNLI
jgi:hypothetical protein